MAAFNKTLKEGIPLGTDFASTIDDKLAAYNIAITERYKLEHYDLEGEGDDDPEVDSEETTAHNAQGRHWPGHVSAVYIADTDTIEGSSGNSKGGLAWADDTGVMYVCTGSGTFVPANVVKDSRADGIVDPTSTYTDKVGYSASTDNVWQDLTTTRLFFSATLNNRYLVEDDHFLELHIAPATDGVDSVMVAKSQVDFFTTVNAHPSYLIHNLNGIIPKGYSWKVVTDLATANVATSFYHTLPF